MAYETFPSIGVISNLSNLTSEQYGGEGPMYYTDPYQLRFQLILDIFEVYVVPIIILIGLIGNTISIIVFFRNPLRKTSSSIYLASLAICDNGFLLMLVFQWLVWFDVQIYHLSGPCQLFTYITNVCAFLSVWYVVGFTVERYIAVFYPLKRQTLCTPTRSKIVVCVLAAIAIIINNFHLWTSHTVVMYGMPVCTPKRQYIQLLTRLNNVDTLVTFIIPFVSIFFMNARIMVRITRMYRRRGSLTKGQIGTTTMDNDVKSSPSRPRNHQSPSRGSHKVPCTYGDSSGVEADMEASSSNFVGHMADEHHQVNNRGHGGGGTFRFQTTLRFTGPDKRHSHQLKITRLLLVVSTTFLVLNLPSHAFRLYGFVMTIIKGSPTSGSNEVILWQQACQLLYYCNFSINIFLYSLCGKSFRQAFWKAFGRVCCQRKDKGKSQKQTSRRQGGTPSDSTRVTRMQMVDIAGEGRRMSSMTGTRL